MPTDVVMPQMGESIAEGTIVRWIKKVGDRIARDEPLFEISTDKVDAEIPSPAAGVIAEIRVKEGETVPINTVVAVIDGSEGARAATAAAAPARAGEPGLAPAPPPAAGSPPATPPSQAPSPSKPAAEGAGPVAAAPAPTPSAAPPSGPPSGQPGRAGKAGPRPAPEEPARAARPEPAQPPAPEAPEEEPEGRQTRSSPLVRKIAREHHVDISQIAGTGIGGRVTKHDILAYIEKGAPAAAPAEPMPAPSRAAAPAAMAPAPAAPAYAPGENVEVVPMTVMRRRIAEHMVASKRTSAHVTTVFEVDMSRVAKIRAERKAEFERVGVKLTFLPFVSKCVVDALRAYPVFNASIDGDNIVYKKDINLGFAVALDWGLIVPVVKKADERNILGLARAVQDLADRARAKQLKPEEVQGGTFTITNPGVYGSLFGTPIIPQPQVAILGIGVLEKRPVVIDDAIAIRWMAYLSISYDHRLIDGAVADQFMAHVKRQLESFDPAAV